MLLSASNTNTKIFENKNGLITRKSDHNTILSKFNFTWKRNKTSNRIEIYNLKNTENQKTFKEMTSNSTNLSSTFDKNDDLNEATNIFLKNWRKTYKFGLRK